MRFPTQPSLPRPQKLAVELNEPYPEIAVERPNRQYARVLERDMASARSEMSAVYQYLYEAWTLDSDCRELGDVCLRIAQIEMHHLHTLGRLVVLLGGDPRCASMGRNGASPWNGSMLFYSRSLPEVLKHNVAQEQAAADIYSAQASQLKDAHVSAMLARIARTELLHRDIFEGFLTRLER